MPFPIHVPKDRSPTPRAATYYRRKLASKIRAYNARMSRREALLPFLPDDLEEWTEALVALAAASQEWKIREPDEYHHCAGNRARLEIGREVKECRYRIECAKQRRAALIKQEVRRYVLDEAAQEERAAQGIPPGPLFKIMYLAADFNLAADFLTGEGGPPVRADEERARKKASVDAMRRYAIRQPEPPAASSPMPGSEPEDDADVIYYHATPSQFEVKIRAGIDIKIGVPFVDFHTGFYVTTNLEQAKKWARIKRDEGDQETVVLAFVVKKAERDQFVTHAFSEEASQEWLYEVIEARLKGTGLEKEAWRKTVPKDTDIMSGPLWMNPKDIIDKETGALSFKGDVYETRAIEYMGQQTTFLTEKAAKWLLRGIQKGRAASFPRRTPGAAPEVFPPPRMDGKVEVMDPRHYWVLPPKKIFIANLAERRRVLGVEELRAHLESDEKLPTQLMNDVLGQEERVIPEELTSPQLDWLMRYVEVYKKRRAES